MSTDTLEAATIDRNQIASDFAASVGDKMPSDVVDRAVAAMLATTSKYPISNGSIIGGLFYVRISCDISVNGKHHSFIGNGGGLFTVPGGALLGDIYTDDASRLVASTVSFQVNATPVYVNVNFFDGSSNLLGNLQSGAVSFVTGVGGGSGSWS